MNKTEVFKVENKDIRSTDIFLVNFEQIQRVGIFIFIESSWFAVKINWLLSL